MTENERFIALGDGFDFIVRDTITGDDLIDADGVVDVLNDYENETEQLRDRGNNLEKKIHIYETTLKESIQNERTHLGHNALKQLAENLGVEL